jgi:hypothetical protein
MKVISELFSNSLLLLAVYFWYDTLKLALEIFANKEDLLIWILWSVVVTILVIYGVWVLNPESSDIFLAGPPREFSDENIVKKNID